MKRLLAALVLLLACASADEPTETEITGACVRAFRAVLEAWEPRFGRVPTECAYLDAEIDVQLAAAPLPCDGELGANQERTGCLRGGAIYLLEDESEAVQVDASVHEWAHALAECVLGAPDIEHVNAQIWIDYGDDTVEAWALAGVVSGRCL